MAIPPYVRGHDLLAGKVVVITAAPGAGVGGGTARRCLEEGARVVISDAHERRLTEAEKDLVAHGDVLAVPCDVTDEAQVQRLYDTTAERYGRIDVAINNAGLG